MDKWTSAEKSFQQEKNVLKNGEHTTESIIRLHYVDTAAVRITFAGRSGGLHEPNT